MKNTRFRELTNRRTIQSPEGDNSNWAISYGDMITLLLTFFVLYFHIGSDNFEIKAIENLIQSNFTTTSKKADLVWGKSNINATSKGDKIIIEFPNVSFFKTAEFELSDEGKKVLSEFAKEFSTHIQGMHIVVRGYTDNRPVKNKKIYKDNLELSLLRSISAVRHLSANGIPLEAIRTGGFGESDKSEELSDEELLKFDRKIVLVVEPIDKTERTYKDFKKSFDLKKGGSNEKI